jgi:hypothetical protein
MKALLSQFVQSLPQIVTVLLVLAAVGVLASTGHLSADNAIAIISLIIGATGVAAGLVLGNIDKPNLQLIVHTIIALAILGLVVALSVRNILTETQIVGVIGVLLGSGTVAAVAGSNPAPSPAPSLQMPVLIPDASAPVSEGPSAP